MVFKRLGYQHPVQASMFNLFTSISSPFRFVHGFTFPVSLLCTFPISVCLPDFLSLVTSELFQHSSSNRQRDRCVATSFTH